MKKLLSALSLFVFAAAISTAADLRENVQAQLAKEVQKAVAQAKNSNTGAINQNKVVNFEVHDLYLHGEKVSDRMDTGCKAYPIAQHWLLVAGTCARPVNGHDELLGELAVTHHRLIPYSKDIHFAYNDRVMLVWSENYNFKGPFVNVLATKSAEQLFTLSASYEVKINTARWGRDAVKTRSLKAGSVREGKEDKMLFQLNERNSDLSGTATDPLFLIQKEGQQNEFLAGYNNGVMDYYSARNGLFCYHGDKSADWYSLQEEDLQFIKETVQENRNQDWSQIKTRLFFNQTKAPYFTK